MPQKEKPAATTKPRTTRESRKRVLIPKPGAKLRRSQKPEAVAKRARAAERRSIERQIKEALHKATPPWMGGHVVRKPRKTVTAQQLRQLGMWLAKFNEAAAVLGMSAGTLSDRMRGDPALRQAWDEGHELGKANLFRRQLQVAYSNTPQAAVLLVHLGKTVLGQHERRELTGAGGGPVRYTHIRRTIVDPALPEGEQETDVTRYGDEGPEQPGTRH